MRPDKPINFRHAIVTFTVLAGLGSFANRASAVEARPAPPPDEVAPDALPPEDLESDGFGPRPEDDRGPGGPDRFGPRGSRERRMGAMLWSRLSDEERQQLREFIAEHFPERFEEIQQLEANQERLQMHMGRILPEMMRLRELSEHDPQVFEMRIREIRGEFRLRQIARQLRFGEGDPDRKALEKEARQLIEQQFDLRQQRMEAEIMRLEEKIAQLRAGLEDRAASRDVEVDQALERLTSGQAPEGPRPRHHQRFRGRDRADEKPD